MIKFVFFWGQKRTLFGNRGMDIFCILIIGARYLTTWAQTRAERGPHFLHLILSSGLLKPPRLPSDPSATGEKGARRLSQTHRFMYCRQVRCCLISAFLTSISSLSGMCLCCQKEVSMRVHKFSCRGGPLTTRTRQSPSWQQWQPVRHLALLPRPLLLCWWWRWR
jgi:hypothetical protein